MPVTVRVADRASEEVRDWLLPTDLDNPNDFLDLACESAKRKRLYVVQTSYSFSQAGPNPAPSTKGLFYALLNAYNCHHHLRLRADDIWIAVLTQFGSYVRAHPEELRGVFVGHEDTKELVIVYEHANRYTVDYNDFAARTTDLMRSNLVDAALFDWMMPDFSTTTPTDRTVASIVMMATMQNYFGLNLTTYCGIPSVTLLGDRGDYETLQRKIEGLGSYGGEVAAFGALLTPIVRYMIRSFDAPSAPEVVDFWSRMMDKHSLRSGQTIYSGWATAFCFWDKDGCCLAKAPEDKQAKEPEGTASVPVAAQTNEDPRSTSSKAPAGVQGLVLDSVQYHVVDVSDVPPGWTSVPVRCKDLVMGENLELQLMAGSFGISCTESSPGNEDGIVLDTVQPALGWIVCESEEKHKASGDAAPFRIE